MKIQASEEVKELRILIRRLVRLAIRAGKAIANPRELNPMLAVRVQSESLGIVFRRNRSVECGSIGGQSDQADHLYSRHLACTVQQSALTAKNGPSDRTHIGQSPRHSIAATD